MNARYVVFAAAASLALGAAALADHHETEEAGGDVHADMMQPAIGPAVGADVAAALAAQDQSGAARTFADLTGENGAVVMFSRSLDWCPFCKAQAQRLEGRVADIEAHGYSVVVVTTDTVEKLASYEMQTDTAMTLLADPDSEMIAALDLLDPSFEEGSRSYGLPYPTTLIVGADGTVQASLMVEELVGEDGAYRTRIEAQDVVDAVAAASPEA